MARKKIDLRKVRPTKRYTVRELAESLGITPRAIYWDIHVDGLPFYLVNGRKRIWGTEFIEFTKARRQKHKRYTKKDGEFFCLNCSDFFMPENKEITIEDYPLRKEQIKYGTILLKGVCPRCGKYIYQVSNISKKEELEQMYKIQK